MFLSNTLSVVLALASFASAFPTRTNDADFSVVEKLNGPPAGWVKDDTITFDRDASTVTLRIHLQRQGVAKFHDLAMNIATPGHELYGKHLSQNVINAMIAPKDESRDLVMEWLASEGLSEAASISSRADSVLVEASLPQIEKLLKAEYSVFVQEQSGEAVIRTLEYSLPNSLAGHIKMVQPTTFFGLRALRSEISGIHAINRTEDAINGIEAVTGCSGTTITPTCLANLYNFASSTSTQTAGLIGIAGFLEQHPSTSDLKVFLDNLAVFSNTAETYTCTLINGGTCPTTTDPGIEANLDVQYARAITKEIPNIFFSTGGSPPIVAGTGANTNEPYLQFLDFLLDLSGTALPNTVSISYGDDEDTVPLDYADEVCTLFSTLGARGVSILVASGDSGVGTTCDSGANGAKGFDTSFPASCPWVTVVGGTTGNSPEKAWTDGGGGFSNVFGQPSYQSTVVDKWVTTTGDSSGFSAFFNTSGRAYPDVAAQATNFVIVADGEEEGVDGTSCATPTFASVIQLVNSELVAAGKAPLGFLNPWLYGTVSGTTGLTDITSGSNTGCSGVISGAGFKAVTGWDPATGLGTPNFVELVSLAGA